MLPDPHRPEPVAPTGRQYTISHGEDHATIVELGGGVRSYVARGRELLDGFAEDEQVSSSRGQPLIPWPNRIEGGKYEWDGETHQLALTEPAKGNATHGLLRFTRWQCRRQGEGEVVMEQLLLPHPGYPFALAVAIRYRVGPDGLEVETTARNVGAAALPYASGQHPYLAPPSGDGIDGCSVTLRAGTYLPTDERGIPLPAQAVSGTPFDLRGGRPLEGLVLDTAFGDLDRDRDGRAAVRLTDGDGGGTELWVDAAYPYLQLFTGDTLAATRRRRGLGAEPMTAPPNAFRSGANLVRLEPGVETTSCWGMRAI